MAHPLTIEIIKSSRGKDKATIQGFAYTLAKSSEDVLIWLCVKRGECKARIHTKNNVVIKPLLINDLHYSHSHGSDPIRIEMLKGYNNIKERASKSEESTRLILSYGIDEMSSSSIAKLPSIESVKRRIRQYKSKSNVIFSNSTCVSEIEIPQQYTVTANEEPFLLFDSGVGDNNRIIVFSTPKFFSILKESKIWYADGTFKVVPDLFYQLYTIHGEKDGVVYPCVYALLTGKSESIYNRLIRILLEIEPTLDPIHIMLDFEKAAMNAFEENFVAIISGCFFHLSQSIFRKIQSEGLTTQYQTDHEFLLKLKMLPSLAFVPEIDVVESFNILISEFPQSALNVAKYFEDNYIGKLLPDQTRRIPLFPIRIWNMFERVHGQLSRTNNAVEGWHNAFQSSIGCSHPNINKFFKYLQREQSLQEANLIKWETGATVKKSKRSITTNERILKVVSEYGTRDIMTYLKGIAYNFDY